MILFFAGILYGYGYPFFLWMVILLVGLGILLRVMLGADAGRITLDLRIKNGGRKGTQVPAVFKIKKNTATLGKTKKVWGTRSVLVDLKIYNLMFDQTEYRSYELCLDGKSEDYEVMLDFHKENNADVTIAVMPVPMEEASRFGIMITDDNNQITEFEEKPEHPRSNLASMGIYIFSWPILRNALIQLSSQPNCDFGKHIIPYCHDNGNRLFAFEFNGYWKDVGTLGSYWEANMELIDIIPEFNLYEEFWKIYTKSDAVPPQYVSAESKIEKSLITGGAEIYGDVYNSVIGAGVTIGKGTVVRDSIIMKNTTIGENCTIDKAIIAEEVEISDGVVMGIGEEVPNKVQPKIYSFGLVTIGENSYIPPNVKIGKNTAIAGDTTPDDYNEGVLASGETLIKVGER